MRTAYTIIGTLAWQLPRREHGTWHFEIRPDFRAGLRAVESRMEFLPSPFILWDQPEIVCDRHHHGAHPERSPVAAHPFPDLARVASPAKVDRIAITGGKALNW